MESGTPDQKSTREGWLNRYLALRGTCEAGCTHDDARLPFRAVAMSQQTPRILEGPQPTIAMSSLDEFSVRASGPAVDRLEALYRTGNADVVHAAGGEMFEAVKILRAANPRQYAPRNGAQYPASQFGQRLKQIAQLIKADVGLEVAFADVGGWDTHVNQGGTTGQLALRTTCCVVDPNSARPTPPLPCEPMTIRSTDRSAASRRISRCARPETITSSISHNDRDSPATSACRRALASLTM
jgi:uncharacterized protein (DUF1501 family)